MPREHTWDGDVCTACWMRRDWAGAGQPCGSSGDIAESGKLSGADYAAIKRAYHAGETSSSLATRFGVSQRHIMRIAGPRRPNLTARKLSDADVADIRRRRARGETLTSIAARYSIHHGHVYKIAAGIARRAS